MELKVKARTQEISQIGEQINRSIYSACRRSFASRHAALSAGQRPRSTTHVNSLYT